MGEIADETFLLRDRDKVWRKDEAVGTLPACEDFKSQQLARAELNQRLKVRKELSALQCPICFPTIKSHVGILRL